MKKAKILFISHEIFPYLELTDLGKTCRQLPQGIQEHGKEIRTFMPKFGCINERRNQLHEVIRLSGMNLIIDDSDHPLIIKVASIQAARMQVYFIDNEEYFQRKAIFRDSKKKFFKDNDDRALFFSRGVLETVKKLGWSPDIIHCHGWMTSLVPLLIKTSYKEDPMFKDSKVVYSVCDDKFEESFSEDFSRKVMMEGMSAADLKDLKTPTWEGITMNAISKSDAVIQTTPTPLDANIKAAIKKGNKVFMEFQSADEYVDACNNFYDELLVEDGVLMD
ncbi:MAG TPA: glycogen/starch synthase [Bacteroidia bacterium]|nr:glycogen/starch synthase [Bacteroidia bacterium]